MEAGLQTFLFPAADAALAASWNELALIETVLQDGSMLTDADGNLVSLSQPKGCVDAAINRC